MDSAATCDAGLQFGTFLPKHYNRWIVLVFYLVAEIFLGIPYSMGLFSQALTDDLGLNHVEVGLVASFGQLGFWGMAFFAGLLLHVLKPIYHIYYLFVAACLGGGGLLYMGMSLNRRIPTNIGFMCVTWFMANLAVVMVLQISTKVSVGNFPQKDRGKICGIINSAFGMSSAVLAVLYDAFFIDHGTHPVATFSLYLSIVVFCVVCLCAIPTNMICPSLIDYVPEHAQGIVPSFRPILSWNYGLIAILVVITSCELAGIAIANITTGVIVCVFIICGYAIPSVYGSVMVSTLGPENKLMPAAAPVSELELPKMLSESECCEGIMVEEDSNIGTSASDSQPPSLELPWYNALRNRTFWAVFICFSIGGGSGLMLFNHVTSITISLGLNPNSAFVALMGLGNSLSRLLSGVLSDIIHNHGLPRSFLLLIALGLAALNNFLLSMGNIGYLYIGLFIGSLCIGPLTPTILGLMADYFGVRHIAVNYGMQDLGPAVCTFAFSTGLVSVFYSADGESDCIGRECFQNTFIIIGCLCAVCIPIVYFILLKPDYAHLKTQMPKKSTNDVGKGENG
eukprot:221353_1